jgi:hypothetical protein
MYELRRISLMNWNLLELEDIEISGTTALIGAVGVGKSTILDAIQTVVNGNQKSKLKLNRAAGVMASKRSVLEYCLGHTEETLSQGATRSHCDTILVLTYHDPELKHSVATGVVLYAEAGALREETRHRFVAPGVDFSFASFGDRTPAGDLVVSSWEEVLNRVRVAAGDAYWQTGNARAGQYIETYLKVMRTGAQSPNAIQFQKRFHNAIAFEEISSPTDFVRNFVLDADPVDTELLRSNLQTWDDIAGKIELAEQKVAAARGVRNRYARYADHQFDHLEEEFKIAWHSLRAETLEHEALGVEIAEISEKIADEEFKVERLKAQLLSEREQRERKKEKEREAGVTDARLLAEERLSSERRQRKAKIDELTRGLKSLARVAETRDINHYLPAFVKDAQDAAEDLGRYASSLSVDTPVGNEEELTQAFRRALRAEPAKSALIANLQTENERLAGMRKQASDYERQIRSKHADAPVLNEHVTRFMAKLLDTGIKASSLPQLVEIQEGMEQWVGAAEAALGLFREAIFVPPEQLPKAHEVLRSARMGGSQDLWHVRLVNTARIHEGRNLKSAKANAVVSILETDDPLVRKFLDSQFGHIVMVDTAEELRQHNSAIMQDGSQSQGLSLRVNKKMSPVLGQEAQAALRMNMQYEYERLNTEIAAKTELVRRLQLGERRLEIFEHINASVLGGLLQELSASYAKMEDLRAQRDTEVTPEVKELLDEIAVHEAAIEQIEEDLDAAQMSRLPELTAARSRAEYGQEGLEKTMRVHESALAKIRARDQGEPYVSYRKAFRDFEHLNGGRHISVLEDGLTKMTERDVGWHRTQLREASERQDELISNDRRIAGYLKGISEFLQKYDEDITISDLSYEEILIWLVALIYDLEDTVLGRYKAQVLEIQKKTREEVREMLVVRLSDKFKRAKEELRNLNRRLKRHHFEGLTYLFTWSVDPEMQGLYEMTQRVTRDPERAQDLLANGGDPMLDEAVEQIREIFSGGVDVDRWEDYRQYFTYELRMTHDDVGDDQISVQDEGEIKGVTFSGNLTDRVGKGSGGQKQTPYYVAIAASMAAAYFPGVRHDSGRGMGLVCFDEGFSKLDVNNTQNLLRFFRDLGLQVLVAAPEEKRTSLMELMDTVVNISKLPGGTDLFIRTVAVGERAKRELIEANPERKGYEGFKAALKGSKQFELKVVE